jgi:predicted ribonuclease YlaK
MIYKFYDTCSLLLKVDNLWEEDTTLVLSSITLEELEHIKTAMNKDPDVKFAARKLIHELDEHYGEYDVIVWNNTLAQMMKEMNLPDTQDSKIITSAGWFQLQHQDAEVIFVTNDLSCKHIARAVLNFPVESYIDEDDYYGYRLIQMNDDEMAYFYSNPTENIYNLFVNEYILVQDMEGHTVDKLCWTGENYRHLTYDNFKSMHFGDVKPIKNDDYQALVADSLANNKITMIKGPAGTGKTYLSLGFLIHKLERNKIDKIIIFCNTVATKNSAKLGYYPGTRDEKLLDSQIGNMLSAKLGGRFAVEEMIRKEELVLLPLSDIRGYDTSGSVAGVYISEAQNLDIELMKLALQRIGKDSICIIDGDCNTQVDDIHFAGSSNGMRRASKVFRGKKVYGEVTLKNIYRSEIASIAEEM